MEVGIRQAKIDLSKLIKSALKGEKVVITHHGKPLAMIVPAVPKQDPDRGFGWLKGQKVRRYVQKPNVELFVSIVTPWEIAVKSNSSRRSKMPSASQVEESVERLGARLLFSHTPPHRHALYIAATSSRPLRPYDYCSGIGRALHSGHE